MGQATHLGPWMLGTVKNTTGTTAGTLRNIGATSVTQTYLAATGVIKAAPVAQQMFTLPAGSKIIRLNTEVLVALVTATNCGLTVGTASSASFFWTTFNTGATSVKTVQATIDAAMVVAKTDNIGTADVPIYGTFTAATGDATAGSIQVTIEYVVRNIDGTTLPAYNNA
jgi:hypothetical protein